MTVVLVHTSPLLMTVVPVPEHDHYEILYSMYVIVYVPTWCYKFVFVEWVSNHDSRSYLEERYGNIAVIRKTSPQRNCTS